MSRIICGAGKRRHWLTVGRLEVTREAVRLTRRTPMDLDEAQYISGPDPKHVLANISINISLDSFETEPDPKPVEMYCPRHKVRWLTLAEARAAVAERRDAVCVTPERHEPSE